LGENLNESIIMFLNRLSDLLWLMAREEDKKADLKDE
jgi:cob(I)alamin adenosyltransferase